MKINHLILGDYETNCYILQANPDSRNCLIIDTGLEASDLLDFLDKKSLNPLALILTHGHADHITGAAPLREKFPKIQILIHKDDVEMLACGKMNLSILAGITEKSPAADTLLEDGQQLNIAEIKLKVIHTPGHTTGGICLYDENNNTLFSGDTLFAGSVGRTDLPGGNTQQLLESIKQKIFTLPEQTTVYPGHGPETNVEREKQTNPFF